MFLKALLMVHLIILSITHSAFAIDCQDLNLIHDSKYYNICTKVCEQDQDCEVLVSGCNKFPVNSKSKDQFLEFLKSFPDNICNRESAEKCFIAKCLNKSCILSNLECEQKPN